MQRRPYLITAVAALGLVVCGSVFARGGHYGHHYGSPHYGYSTSYSHHGHGSDDVLIGLLVGGLIGYAISHAYSEHNDADDYPPARASRQPAFTTQYRNSDRTCLQVREYLTKVTVDGKEVDAYGDACLQPDGAWQRGPAKLAVQ